MRSSKVRAGNGHRLQTTSSFSGVPYPGGVYQQSGKQKTGASLAAQQSQQFLGQQPPLASNPPILGGPVGVGVANMPSYADQMHAAFIDYQRQRMEFEQQQQHLLQKLYHYYPDVSGSQVPAGEAGVSGGLSLPPLVPAGGVLPAASGTSLGLGTGSRGGSSSSSSAAAAASSRFAYRRPNFSSNGLQPGAERGSAGAVGSAGPTGSGGLGSNFGFSSSQQRIPGSIGDFYSTQQHMGFMQQQQQDVLRDQQQSVAHQFATSQLAPTTRQSYGMAVPMSSVLGTPTFQPSADVSHVSFSSGNLNYSF